MYKRQGTVVDRALATQIQNAAVPALWIQTETRNVKILSYISAKISAHIGTPGSKMGMYPDAMI